MTNRKARVAIIGARGIGRHHANWWTLEGAHVCAIVGKSKEPLTETVEILRTLFDFQGRTFTNIQQMLKETSPDYIDVCSPPMCHYAHAKAALEHGAHVLCEKPLVYDPTVDRLESMHQAQTLVDAACRCGVLLGVCTQYSAGADVFRRLWHGECGDVPLTRFIGHIEAPAKGRSGDPRRIWADLGPHPISMCQALMPGAKIDWSTLKTHFHDFEAFAEFDTVDSRGQRVACTLLTRNSVNPPANVRRCVLNDYEFRVEPDRDENGVFRSQIVSKGGVTLETDFMRIVIREFLAGRPITSTASALENLDVMMHIMERGVHEGAPESAISVKD